VKHIFDNEEKVNDSIGVSQFTRYGVVYWLRQQPYRNNFIICSWACCLTMQTTKGLIQELSWHFLLY